MQTGWIVNDPADRVRRFIVWHRYCNVTRVLTGDEIVRMHADALHTGEDDLVPDRIWYMDDQGHMHEAAWMVDREPWDGLGQRTVTVRLLGSHQNREVFSGSFVQDGNT